jgi:hypothetical protein
MLFNGSIVVMMTASTLSTGSYDAAWQICVYWYVCFRTSMLSANSLQVHGRHPEQQSKARQLRQLLQGLSISWSSDRVLLRRHKKPYMDIFLSTWVLLAGGLVVALPAMLLNIKDTVPLEEDLKFTEEYRGCVGC